MYRPYLTLPEESEAAVEAAADALGHATVSDYLREVTLDRTAEVLGVERARVVAGDLPEEAEAGG